MNKRTLTDEQVHEICLLLLDGEKIKDIAEFYGVSTDIISIIKHKKSYREITSLYNLEKICHINKTRLNTKYSDEFIDFIIECIKNNISLDEILSDERCEINDKDKLSSYISRIRTGRMHKNRLIKYKIYHDNINDPINNVVIGDDMSISIANDIKENPLITNKELVDKYNVTTSIISNIRCGRTYTNITDIKEGQYALNNSISDEIIISIANDIKTNPNISNKELANKYNQTDIIISNIRNGKSHLNITGIKEGQYALINNKEIIISIANDIKTNPNISNKELVNKYNLSSVTISNIRNGKIHSDITGIKKGQYNLKCIIDNSTIESIIKDIKENPKMLLIDICKKYRVSRSYVYTIKTKIIKGIE